MAGMFETPVKQTRPMASKVSPPSETVNQLVNRSSSHVVETQFNGHLPLPTKDTSMGIVNSPFTFAYTQGPVKPYRFMFEKIKEKSEGIDERIDYIASLIQSHHGIEAFANPSKPSQEAIYAYGLVSSDDGSEQKLNEKSIVLQTSRDLGMGKRVLLDLSRVNSYSFFPGQVIGVKGTNHNGIRFHVDEVLMVG
jgi:DNA polymerase alpha subunit B